MVAKKPYAFTFWQSEGKPPDYISMCLESQTENLAPHFTHIHLDFESCLDWVPQRDEIWAMSVPREPGKSASQEGRRFAIFTGMLRVALLKEYGGIWVDADTVVFPEFGLLAPMAKELDLVSGETAHGRITNSVLGCRAGSLFMGYYWDAIESKMCRKRADNDGGAYWGEYGFNLLKRVLIEVPSISSWIAPFGSIVSFDTRKKSVLFDSEADIVTQVSPVSLVLSVFNNSIGIDLRHMSKDQLIEGDTVFANAWLYAMQRESRLSEHFSICTTAQLAHLDRSKFVISALMEKKELTKTINELKEQIKKKNLRIEELEEKRNYLSRLFWKRQ